MVDMLCLVIYLEMHVLFPYSKSTILIAWFDLTGLDRSSLNAEDEKGMLTSLTSGTQFTIYNQSIAYN